MSSAQPAAAQPAAVPPVVGISLLVTDAVVLPMADTRPGEPDWFDGWLAVDDDGQVAALGPGPTPVELSQRSARVRELGGAFVAPGQVRTRMARAARAASLRLDIEPA